MKSLFSILVLTLVSFVAFANDGGIAAIQVNQIKMRETAYKNGQEVVVKKIVKPSFTITIEGGEAKKLQKILPSESSVITAMHPEIAKDYNESFKSLGIYSLSSKEDSSKSITISCSDAEFSEDGSKVIKTGKTVCTIYISATSDEWVTDSFGDMQSFEPKSCK